MANLHTVFLFQSPNIGERIIQQHLSPRIDLQRATTPEHKVSSGETLSQVKNLDEMKTLLTISKGKTSPTGSTHSSGKLNKED